MKICNVIQESEKVTPRIKKTLQNNHPLHCQFKDLHPEHEFEGENFCILHLPFEEKKDKNIFDKTNEIIISQINKNQTDFSYVSTCGLELKDLKIEKLFFKGASLSSLTLSNCNIYDTLNLNNVQLRGVNKINNCKRINILRLQYSVITGHLKIENTKIMEFYSWESNYYSETNLIRLDYKNHGIIFDNAKIKIFRFTKNQCQLCLVFLNNSEITEELDLENTVFYTCPSFFDAKTTNSSNEIIFPEKNNFNLKKISPLRSIFHNVFKNSFTNIFDRRFINIIKPTLHKKLCLKIRSGMTKRSNAFYNEYKKFRALYDLTKSRNMFLEQSNFFYLMQYCFEKTQKIKRTDKIISFLYRKFSDYGQNSLKPLIWLAALKFAFAKLYSVCLNISYKTAFFISIQQTIRPYRLLFDKHLSYSSYFISFIDSTLSIILISLLLITLRWNFRKV